LTGQLLLGKETRCVRIGCRN